MSALQLGAATCISHAVVDTYTGAPTVNVGKFASALTLPYSSIVVASQSEAAARTHIHNFTGHAVAAASASVSSRLLSVTDKYTRSQKARVAPAVHVSHIPEYVPSADNAASKSIHPVSGSCIVLFVNVSVVALHTSVSVDVGNVSVPEFTIVAITGAVSVLFVSVSVVARPTNVSVDVGRVNVPLLTIVAITGAVNVLFVSVSVVARPTSVSVDVGKVSVHVLNIVAITGAVSVLLVNVCVVSTHTRVRSASGIVIVLLVEAEILESWNFACLLVSASSCNVKFASLIESVVVLSSVLFVMVCVAVESTIDQLASGIVIVLVPVTLDSWNSIIFVGVALSYNWKTASDTFRFVPSNTAHAIPPKEPELLYCICVSDPHGDPPHPHVAERTVPVMVSQDQSVIAARSHVDPRQNRLDADRTTVHRDPSVEAALHSTPFADAS